MDQPKVKSALHTFNHTLILRHLAKSNTSFPAKGYPSEINVNHRNCPNWEHLRLEPNGAPPVFGPWTRSEPIGLDGRATCHGRAQAEVEALGQATHQRGVTASRGKQESHQVGIGVQPHKKPPGQSQLD